MKKPFSKIAIVTGASRGIGAAISRRLAADGFGVIINYAASADAAESLATEIEKAGSRALAV
jgi:3-oxoacyl-[acyl-carrier protein] reductase